MLLYGLYGIESWLCICNHSIFSNRKGTKDNASRAFELILFYEQKINAPFEIYIFYICDKYQITYVRKPLFVLFYRRQVSRRLTTNGVVIGLLLTNGAVFMLWSIASYDFMVKNFMVSYSQHVKFKEATNSNVSPYHYYYYFPDFCRQFYKWTAAHIDNQCFQSWRNDASFQ